MKIADLFFEGRLDDGKLLIDAKKSGDKAGQTLGQRMSMGIKKGSADLVSGIKLGAGIAAFGGLTAAVSGTVSILGDAIQAAREDEESQSRLGAALKANIPNWNGNTAAIEKTIDSRQRLGFTDEEQRTSLALLVVATNDETKALELQRAAMDLARLKGISLEEASSALIKVEGGQFRALKALGIQLPKNATATEALAAVQEAANGSAEAYAKTSAGKLLASQIKVGEAMEKLGYILLPAVSEAMLFVADVAAGVASGIADIAKAVEPLIAKVQELVKFNPDANGGLDKFFDDLSNAPYQAGLVVRGAIDDIIGQEIALLTGTERTIPQVAEVWKAAGNDIGDSLADVGDRGGRAIEAPLKEAITLSVKGAFGSDLAARNDVSRAMGNRLGAGIAQGIREKRDAVDQSWQDLLDALKNAISPTRERARLLGQLASKELIAGMKSQDPAVRAQAAATKQVIIDRLTELGANAKNIGKTGMAELAKAMKSKDPDIRAAARAIYAAAVGPKSPIGTMPAKATSWGAATTAAYAAGLRSRIDLVASAAGAITKAVGNQLRASSPPVATSPLHFIGHWGERTIEEYAKGLVAGVTSVDSALSSLTGRMVASLTGPVGLPSLGSAVPSMAGVSAFTGSAAVQAAAGGVVNNYYNTANVEGLVKAPDPLSIARELGRAARNGQFRPRSTP